MSNQITTAFVNQYRSNVMMLVQQRGSRLRPAVRVESQDGEFAFYDQVGAGVMVDLVSRHQDTPLQNTPHARRRVGLVDAVYADLIDRADRVRLLIDPTGPYTTAAMWAAGRKMDDVIIAAANGTAQTGKTGSTNTALPAGQKVAVGAGPVSLAKLLNAKEILDGNENDPEEERYYSCRAKDLTTLFNTTEIKSADYNTVKALAAGQIDTFLGFKFIRSQRLILSTDAVSSANIAWRKSALLLAVAVEPTVDIGPRRDKNNSIQVFLQMGVGATRMEEEGVVEVSVTL